MARCISQDKDGTTKYCEFLKFNQKGNYCWHCNWNPNRPCQIVEIDLRSDYPCPLDIHKRNEEECQ